MKRYSVLMLIAISSFTRFTFGNEEFDYFASEESVSTEIQDMWEQIYESDDRDNLWRFLSALLAEASNAYRVGECMGVESGELTEQMTIRQFYGVFDNDNQLFHESRIREAVFGGDSVDYDVDDYLRRNVTIILEGYPIGVKVTREELLRVLLAVAPYISFFTEEIYLKLTEKLETLNSNIDDEFLLPVIILLKEITGEAPMDIRVPSFDERIPEVFNVEAEAIMRTVMNRAARGAELRGMMYLNGIGVEKDWMKAEKLFSHSGLRGVNSARSALVVEYTGDDEGRRDWAKAYAWFRIMQRENRGDERYEWERLEGEFLTDLASKKAFGRLTSALTEEIRRKGESEFLRLNELLAEIPAWYSPEGSESFYVPR